VPARKLESVLCVDDDPDINAVLHATLTLIGGFDVRMARSGGELITLALERRPDLLLLDVMMPGLDGPATLELMRRNPRIAHIPVIFLTAKVLSSDMDRVFPSGALGVIAKPFDPLKLCQEIDELWEGRVILQPPDPRSAAQVSVQVDELAVKFLGRSTADVVRLRRMIEQAGRGDEAALEEVQQIAHKIHGSGAMLGLLNVSAFAEAIEHLAAGILADLSAHGPIAESALVRELSEGIEALAEAVGHCAAAHGLRAPAAARARGSAFQREAGTAARSLLSPRSERSN
jgi:two-component system OmpR family response regulator